MVGERQRERGCDDGREEDEDMMTNKRTREMQRRDMADDVRVKGKGEALTVKRRKVTKKGRENETEGRIGIMMSKGEERG